MRTIPGRPAIFSLSDLCAWSGATPTQVEHWVRNGIIVPLEESSGRGSPRIFSLQSVIEAAIVRELTTATAHMAAGGLSVKQLQALLTQLRLQVNQLPQELRASATFDRYVEAVDKLVELVGPGPNYKQWRADVAKALRHWKRNRPVPIDQDLLNYMAAARATERAAAEKDAR